MFPKIIHQTYKDHNIPNKWKLSPIMWKKYHPDYKYMFWTDNDIREYIKKNYPQYLKIHDNYKYNIQRADFIRYFILYDFGGIYSDLDLYPIENIEPHLEYNTDVLLVKSGNAQNYLTNSLMISKKGAKLWEKVHQQLRKPIPFYAIGRHWEVMLSTGPLMLTEVCFKKENEKLYKLLPNEKFMAYTTYDDIKKIKKGAILIPLEGQSWNGIDSHVYNFMNKNKYNIVIIIILIIVIILLVLYRKKIKKGLRGLMKKFRS